MDKNRRATAELKKFAVQFDNNVRYNDQKAWPYWYPLIPSPFEDTDQLNGGLGLMGWELGAGEIRQISVKVDRDSPFSHINTKWTPLTPDVVANLTGTAVFSTSTTTVSGAGTLFLTELRAGQRIAYIDNSGFYRVVRVRSITDNLTLTLYDIPKYGGTFVNFGLVKWKWYTTLPIAPPLPSIPTPGLEYIYTPLTRYLKVGLNIPSLANRNYYGERAYTSDQGLVARRTPVTTMQGVNDGNPVLRTPDALIPAEGTITFTVENTYTQPVHVNCSVFGYKIALDTDVGF